MTSLHATTLLFTDNVAEGIIYTLPISKNFLFLRFQLGIKVIGAKSENMTFKKKKNIYIYTHTHNRHVLK